MGTPIRRIITSKTSFFNLADFISCVKPCRMIRSSCSSKNLHRSPHSRQSSVNTTMHLQKYKIILETQTVSHKNVWNCLNSSYVMKIASVGNIIASGGNIITSGGNIITSGGNKIASGGKIFTSDGNIITSVGKLFTSDVVEVLATWLSMTCRHFIYDMQALHRQHAGSLMTASRLVTTASGPLTKNNRHLAENT